MKKKKKLIYPLVIVILTLLMGVGFASVNSIILGIEGTAQANLQDGIYITDVNYVSSVSADYENSKIKYAYQTILNSNIILSETDSNSSITYEVTIYNSNNEDYAFVGEDHLNSIDTYSNQDIIFRINGLNYGDILTARDSVTFTITFYYKNNVLASNNVLESILNFKYRKIYSVTYQDFSSTVNYPTYAIDGESLIVSFGTLDTPIEVKKSNSIMSSSEYTYNNYTLTINNVNGNINIRKLKKYTISNMVTNGSFENGLTGWSKVGSTSTGWYETAIAAVGSKAIFRSPSNAGRNYLSQGLSFTKNHKYYFFLYGICETTQHLIADFANTGAQINLTVDSTAYRRGSVIYNCDKTYNNVVNINYGETTDNVILDGVAVIDLTSAFGTGNEPSKSWCDSNIHYFDGSYTIYK